ncbi:MAG: hypothetical protein Q8Q42_02380 [Nanoarchaeota archaeon]|nr:hypothetical protein [Nanoarchaeota archaeon]
MKYYISLGMRLFVSLMAVWSSIILAFAKLTIVNNKIKTIISFFINI